MSGDHNMHQKPRSYLDDFGCPRCGHCCADREWVGLTDQELEEMHNEIKVRLMGTYRTEDIYRSIEAKLREKNHG